MRKLKLLLLLSLPICLTSCATKHVQYDNLTMKVHHVVYKEYYSLFRHEPLGYLPFDTVITINNVFLKNGRILQTKTNVDFMVFDEDERYKLIKNKEFFYKKGTTLTRINRFKFKRLLYGRNLFKRNWE